jgi:bacterioferritin (cytochrome b1)
MRAYAALHPADRPRGAASPVAMRLNDALASPVHAPFGQPSANLEDMALENLDATQSGMQAMRDFVRFIGSRDTVTRRLLRAILEADQGRADELATVAGPRPQAKSAGA